jgi:hypothetical protein
MGGLGNKYDLHDPWNGNGGLGNGRKARNSLKYIHKEIAKENPNNHGDGNGSDKKVGPDESQQGVENGIFFSLVACAYFEEIPSSSFHA